MAFALWLTGLPASGKSSIARALASSLEQQRLAFEVLESDDVRRFLTPTPTYERGERDLFYRALVFCGGRLVRHDVSVVFDATANRRVYRELARQQIGSLVEVFVDCPLDVCMRRDEKGTYEKGRAGVSSSVPGLGEPYEPPLAPDLRIDSASGSPEQSASRIVALLQGRGLIARPSAR